MASFVVNESKVNINSQKIEGSIDVYGFDTRLDIKADRIGHLPESFGEYELDRLELIHIREGNVNITANRIDYGIEACAWGPTRIVNITANVANFIDIKSGHVRLNINELNALSLENTSAKGYVSNITNFSNAAAFAEALEYALVFGYSSWAGIVSDNPSYHEVYPDSLKSCNIDLTIENISSKIHVGPGASGIINLKSNFAEGLHVDAFSNAEIKLDIKEMGYFNYASNPSNMISDYSTYNTGYIKFFNTLFYQYNANDNQSIVNLNNINRKIYFSNCIFLNKSAGSGTIPDIFVNKNATQNIYVLGTVFSNIVLGANVNVLGGQVYIDSNL